MSRAATGLRAAEIGDDAHAVLKRRRQDLRHLGLGEDIVTQRRRVVAHRDGDRGELDLRERIETEIVEIALLGEFDGGVNPLLRAGRAAADANHRFYHPYPPLTAAAGGGGASHQPNPSPPGFPDTQGKYREFCAESSLSNGPTASRVVESLPFGRPPSNRSFPGTGEPIQIAGGVKWSPHKRTYVSEGGLPRLSFGAPRPPSANALSAARPGRCRRSRRPRGLVPALLRPARAPGYRTDSLDPSFALATLGASRATNRTACAAPAYRANRLCMTIRSPQMLRWKG